jgi:hypothetical protein
VKTALNLLPVHMTACMYTLKIGSMNAASNDATGQLPTHLTGNGPKRTNTATFFGAGHWTY